MPIDSALPTAYPALIYRDALGMLDWLERSFGFQRRLVVRGEDGGVRHAELSLGAAVVMVSSARAEHGWASPLDLGGATAGVCVFVEDPDPHHARAVAAGAEILYELHDSHYGSREYTARDPEGTAWTFGTYVPGAYWDGKGGG